MYILDRLQMDEWLAAWICLAVLSAFGMIECAHRCALYRLNRTYKRRVHASRIIHVCPPVVLTDAIPVQDASARLTYVKPLGITLVGV